MTNKQILVYYTSFSDRALEPKNPTSHQDHWAFIEAPHQKNYLIRQEKRVCILEWPKLFWKCQLEAEGKGGKARNDMASSLEPENIHRNRLKNFRVEREKRIRESHAAQRLSIYIFNLNTFIVKQKVHVEI